MQLSAAAGFLSKLIEANNHEPGPTHALFSAARMMAKLFLLALGLVCVLAFGWWMYCQNQNEVGRSEWARVKAELEARGEKLEWAAFVPEPVPDEVNFARTPLIEAVGYRETPGSEAKRRLESREVGAFLSFVADMDLGRPPDLAAMARTLQSNIGSGFEFTSTNPAEMIIEWFRPLEEDFKELRAASKLPYAQWRLNPTNGFNPPMIDFIMMRRLAQQMVVLATADLTAGNPRAALTNIRVNLTLAGGLERHTTLVAMMIGTAIDGLTVPVIWQGLSAGKWDDASLVELEELLSPIDLPVAFQHVLRCERASIHQNFGGATGLALVGGAAGLIPGAADSPLYPHGWLLQAQAVYAEAIQEHAIALYDERRRVVWPERAADVNRFIDVAKSSSHPRYKIAAIAIPNFQKALMTSVFAQTRINQTRIAIALERYRLRQGESPKDLAALVPNYLPALPNDLIGGGPLAYRRLAGDRFTLWSIGWNQVDDGAVVSTNREQGDWVWISRPKE